MDYDANKSPTAALGRAFDYWVALCERAIENSSQPHDIVLDPFLGSGSTLIAAERTGRRCYGMEIDPTYCRVVIARWEAFSGEKAEREG